MGERGGLWERQRSKNEKRVVSCKKSKGARGSKIRLVSSWIISANVKRAVTEAVEYLVGGQGVLQGERGKKVVTTIGVREEKSWGTGLEVSTQYAIPTLKRSPFLKGICLLKRDRKENG